MTDATMTAEAPQAPAEPIRTRHTAIAGGVLAAIIAFADLLFFPHDLGINLPLFLFAIGAGALALRPAKLRQARTALYGAIFVVGLLPLVEATSLYGWICGLGGLTLFVLYLTDQLPSYENWFGTFVRFAVLAPARLIADAFSVVIEAGRQHLGGRLVRLALMWLVPLVCAAVFLMLFAAANPVLQDWLQAIRLSDLKQFINIPRMIIWLLAAAIAWPLLMPQLLRWTALPEMQGPVQPKPESLVFGAGAIRNSLIVFNALFAVQTVMDLMYLWGGVRLPDGLTYADYAHRAAYPLIITAILAGAFVLAAMRRNGPGQASPLIRGLVYLWIGQNVWLVVSAILRLKLYLDVYMLTELRIAAGIWMGLVMVGLILILARILFDKSNKWLVTANLTALALTLYGLAWINLPALISRYNVEHSIEMTGQGFPLDTYYMTDLGPEAIPALDLFLAKAKFASADTLKTFSLERDNLAERFVFRALDRPPVLARLDWQAWTYRHQRLRQYLASQPFAPEAPPDSNWP